MFREPYEALLIREKSDINFFAKLRVSVKAGDQEAKEGTRRPLSTPRSPRHPKVGPTPLAPSLDPIDTCGVVGSIMT
jgi:hypothetical protein